MKKEFILGTWGLSGSFGPKDKADVRNILAAALDHGITTVDTAAVYGDGAMETVLADFQRFKVATKVPAVPKPSVGACAITDHYSSDQITSQVEACLRRLKRDAIDVLQLHNWHPSWEAESILPVFERLKAAGKIIKSGVSLPTDYNAPLPTGFDVVQLPLNIVEDWALPYIAAERTHVVWVRSILAHGILAYGPNHSFAQSDGRASKAASIQARVAKYQAQHGTAQANLKEPALTMIKDIAHVDGVILGCSHVDQLVELLDNLRQ